MGWWRDVPSTIMPSLMAVQYKWFKATCKGTAKAAASFAGGT